MHTQRDVDPSEDERGGDVPNACGPGNATGCTAEKMPPCHCHKWKPSGMLKHGAGGRKDTEEGQGEEYRIPGHAQVRDTTSSDRPKDNTSNGSRTSGSVARRTDLGHVTVKAEVTLVHEDHVPQAHMEVLNSRWYREVYHEMCPGNFVAKQCKNLCANVERVMGEGDGVARNLFRSFVRRGATSIAKLDLTVKSHKGAGFVTFRNIHSLACYSLEGLSQWAARELRSWLHTRCHLLNDTCQFVKLISTKCAKPDETL